MPTKPVIFDIENPRGTLPGASRKTPGSARELSLPDFRYALVSTRFESAKIAVFAIFLFSTVAFAAHASHLTNPDNSFAANSGSAIGALKTSVRSKTTALASATMERMEAAISHMEVASKPSSAPVMVAQVQTPAASRVRRVRRSSHTLASAQVETAANGGRTTSHLPRRAHGKPAAQPEVVAANYSADSFLGHFSQSLSFEGHKAFTGMTDFVQSMSSVSRLRSKGEQVMSRLGSRLDPSNPDNVRDPISTVSDILHSDIAMAAGAALLLYMFFVVVLVQIKGSLRAVGGSHAV